MNWKHIQLIFQREMSDQLRDRRTLFTITVLPILLYPFIGMLMMQVAQFKRDSYVKVGVVGINHWPSDLTLLDAEDKLSIPTTGGVDKLIEFESKEWTDTPIEEIREQASTEIALSNYDLVLIIKPDFEQRLQARLGKSASNENAESSNEDSLAVASLSDNAAAKVEVDADDASQVEQVAPVAQTLGGNEGLEIVLNMARDRAKIAQRRLEIILRDWQKDWIGTRLSKTGISPDVFEPFALTTTDTAPASVKRAMLWSKILPFIMLVWALTGAFYPAIDLCAGEKERGTLETLLSSPARRREIVWGKLGAIWVFSIGSALLNLMSMQLTAGMIVKQLASQGTPQLAEALGPMPFHSMGWLILLLLPMSAFFSALALAVAALARSTKEGQYYLMPLLLVTLPLVAMPMMPSLELNLGTSIVPVSGAIFLVRSLIEGRYSEAFVHLPVVLMVTATCCWFSVRWAIRQFESESVMFRESERWNLRVWVHHLWRDREDTASPTESVLCGVIIIVAMFFAQFLAGSSIDSWAAIAKSTTIVQIGLILTPTLLMAIFLTRSLRRALRIHRAQMSHVFAAILLGFCMHPSYMLLGEGIQTVYQIGDETKLVLQHFQNLVMSQPLISILMLMAVMPAICEELAFRGFIFGGLLRKQGVMRAIIISALFFGFTHTVLQQSIAASLMGVILGIIAWRTGGVICTIIVHAINNSLSLTLAWCGARSMEIPGGLSWAITTEDGSWVYDQNWIAMSVMLTVALFFILSRRSSETHKYAQAELA